MTGLLTGITIPSKDWDATANRKINHAGLLCGFVALAGMIDVRE